MKNIYRLSLNQRLIMISLSVFLPLICMLFYVISSLYQSANAYNQVTDSVTYANIYSREFKTRMDYSMYLAVISGHSIKELGDSTYTVNGVETVDPYAYITEMEEVCDKLSEIASVESNKNQIKRLKHTLHSLRVSVETIEGNIETGGYYDVNMSMLDDDIYILTGIIKESIQDYIYEETTNLANVKAQMLKHNMDVIRISCIVSGMVAIMAFIFSTLSVRSITKPIHEMCVSADRIAKGDFTTRINVKAGKEITVLADQFNEMTEKIGELVEDNRLEQENSRMAEVNLLQAQINPHFLYNTLDTIVWLAEEKQTKDVVEMVTSLSDFFRTTLSEGRDFITVKEEKSHIDSYLKIQQFRYQDILNYRIDIDSEIYDYLIPKLTLQPLVENALYHGIKNKRGKGQIVIRGYMEDSRLYFKVMDNGIGMTPEKLVQLKKTMTGVQIPDNRVGFGLDNVNQRIHHYYGKEYGVFIESEENEGTQATIVLGTKIIELFLKNNTLNQKNQK